MKEKLFEKLVKPFWVMSGEVVAQHLRNGLLVVVLYSRVRLIHPDFATVILQRV